MPEGTEQVTQAEQKTEQATSAATTAAAETAQHVEQAKEQTTAAAASAPSTAIEDTLKGVTDILGRVEVELKRSNDIAEKAVKTTAAAPAQSAKPAIEVAKPKEEVRYIRRNGRKVARKS